MDIQYNSVTGLPDNPLNYLENTNINSGILLILVVILILFYIFFSGISENNSNLNLENGYKDGNGATTFLEILLWSVFIILLLLNGISYFYNIDIIASIKDLLTNEPKLQIKTKNYLGKTQVSSKNQKPSKSSFKSVNNKLTPEVFNIPKNIYTYSDAKALCKAYNSTLATYEDLENAYEKGANWCNYGWSADQLALFPTSKETWEKLQTIKGHENDCGRQGINGGYISNPNAKFGVNCFGIKPKITTDEQLIMNNSTEYPQSIEELEQMKKVNQYKNKLNNILISPFNNKSWNII